MIIGIWIATVIFVVIVFGEIKYRLFDKKEAKVENKEFAKTWEDSMDMDFDELSMECVNNEFVSSQSLAMRGSWRLAQNQVIGTRTFDEIRKEEYRKML